MQVTVSASAGQSSDAVQISARNFTAGASIICTPVGISGTYRVLISNDRPSSSDALASFPSTDPLFPTHWNVHDELVGLSAEKNSNLDYFVQWVRLDCSGLTAGSVTMGVGQAETRQG